MAEKNFKDRLRRADRIFNRMLGRDRGMVRQTAIGGGAAGALAVTGIRKGDELIGVMRYVAATSITDITAEFVTAMGGYTVLADDTIDNTGGTNTTGDYLVVTWHPWENR